MCFVPGFWRMSDDLHLCGHKLAHTNNRLSKMLHGCQKCLHKTQSSETIQIMKHLQSSYARPACVYQSTQGLQHLLSVSDIENSTKCASTSLMATISIPSWKEIGFQTFELRLTFSFLNFFLFFF